MKKHPQKSENTAVAKGERYHMQILQEQGQAPDRKHPFLKVLGSAW